MPDNNSTQNGVAYWVKPTADTVAYFQALPSEFWSDGKNVVVNQGYLQLSSTDAKGQALNVIIPIIEAAAGQKEWDEAAASGAGNVMQDLLTITLLNMGAEGLVVLGFLEATPAGWIMSGLALGATWYSASSNNSLGNFFADAVKNGRKPYTLDQLLQDQHTTIPLNENTNVTMTDASGKTFNFSYANQIAQIQSNLNEQVWTDFLNDLVKETTVQKIALPDRTLTVENLTNLELRNAIDGIDKVSFLLSNITIYVGEKLDLRSHGIYEVQSGDTLSMIAQNLNDGTVTKDLVKLNPWLFDAGRIHFNYPDKVLIAAGTAIDSTQDHILEGDAHAANILKDGKYFRFEGEVA